MLWVTSILCLSYLSFVYTKNSDYLVMVRNSDCSTTYDLDDYVSVILDYHGSDVLLLNPCSIEFTKSSYQKFVCVSTERVKLDCETKLEYHEAFVKNYIYPEKRLTCSDTSIKGDEWCTSEYQDNIFVVIRKVPRQTRDVVKLRIYLKDVSERWEYSVTTSGAWLASIVVPVAVIILAAITTLIQIRVMRRSPRSPRIVYQKTHGTVYIQTGNPGNQPPPEDNVQEPNSAIPLVQGDNYSHLMQTAYPVTSPQSSARTLVASAQISDLGPPPSYDSVVGINTPEFR